MDYLWKAIIPFDSLFTVIVGTTIDIALEGHSILF
jgi:hypothetical protein